VGNISVHATKPADPPHRTKYPHARPVAIGDSAVPSYRLAEASISTTCESSTVGMTQLAGGRRSKVAGGDVVGYRLWQVYARSEGNFIRGRRP
jgi:hypothetical protein